MLLLARVHASLTTQISSAVVANTTTQMHAEATPPLFTSRITALGPTVSPMMTEQALLPVRTRIMISSLVNEFSIQERNIPF